MYLTPLKKALICLQNYNNFWPTLPKGAGGQVRAVPMSAVPGMGREFQTPEVAIRGRGREPNIMR